jgi:LPXTG-site transpeptidase (sortase) family protein
MSSDSPSPNDPDYSKPEPDKIEEPVLSLIRKKLTNIYSDEPLAKDELQEIKSSNIGLSKHQEFILNLSISGKSLADIQTEWHRYYIELPDNQKRIVWNEFYELSGPSSQYFHKVSQQIQATRSGLNTPNSTKVIVAEHSHSTSEPTRKKIKSLPKKLTNRITSGGKLKAKHHIQSLFFGLSLGTFVIFIFMFGFFNEVIIAPFVQPSRNVTSIPIILSTGSIAVSSDPNIIIPKINLEIPVDYTQTSTDQSIIEGALNNGIVHYPSTAYPGEIGNSAFFGHSSNNIFNPGKYKFAFVLLHTLVPGDTFYLVYQMKTYVYQVFDKKIVSPNDIAVLGNVDGKSATVTLITCDPPGTSINRLVIWGQQISPDPIANSNPNTSIASANSATTLPGNGPSLWTRLVHWIL